MDPNSPVQINIQSFADIGRVAHAVRMTQRIRANEFNLNHQTVQAVENGRDTVRAGNVLKYLQELGIRLNLELPPGLTLAQIDQTRRRIPKASL
jgi:hypothetical protein